MGMWPSSEDMSAAGYLAGWALVRRMPTWMTWPLFRLGADIASRNGKGCEQLRANLARVVGPENVTRALVRDSMRSYMRYWMEAFKLPAIHRRLGLYEELKAQVDGIEHLDAALESGKGTILALTHSGNWDMAGVFLVGHQGQFSTVAERLKPETLFDAFVDYRRNLGFDVVPLTGGDPPFAHLAEVLNSGGTVALLAERDLSRTGQPVDFCGEEANVATGPARLALETGANLLVVHTFFTGDAVSGGWGASVSPPLHVTTVEETTKDVAARMARDIAAHPEDWHMLQPQWNVDIARRKAQKKTQKRKGRAA